MVFVMVIRQSEKNWELKNLIIIYCYNFFNISVATSFPAFANAWFIHG